MLIRIGLTPHRGRKGLPVESRPINSRKDSSTNKPGSSSGQFSNDYVKKLMEDKLGEYELKLQSLRQGGNSESQNNNEANNTPESNGEDKKLVMEFMQLKIENLRSILGRTENMNDLENNSKNI